jgi:hypothetical protein
VAVEDKDFNLLKPRTNLKTITLIDSTSLLAKFIGALQLKVLWGKHKGGRVPLWRPQKGLVNLIGLPPA